MARYSIYIKGKDTLYEIPLKFANGKEKIKCDLEEIDYYFARPISENENDILQVFLKETVDKGLIKETPQNKPFIGYKYQNEIRKKEIITNNSFVYTMAKKCLDYKNVDKNHRIPNNSELQGLIEDIIMLAIDDNKAFRSMFYSNLFPKHVYDLINDYRSLLKKDDYSDKVNDMQELKNQIAYNISKYNNFRTIYIWKEKYYNSLNKQDNKDYDYEYNLIDLANKEKNTTSTDIEDNTPEEEIKEEKISVTDLINNKAYYNNLFDWADNNTNPVEKEPTLVEAQEEVKEEKMNVQDFINQYNTEEVYDFLEQYNKEPFVEITDPNVAHYFKEGGLESVLENCSLDEIESLSNEEKQYIGYQTKNRGR